ncbi:hypothetical protein [Novosphingobium rosa]|uniref:hypothetical protein n=1 Tax=Novosphingobium rosa TaxID=76978 RepID=UPI0008321B9E|nr:hypothetical protein [Novosphingobium rosa]
MIDNAHASRPSAVRLSDLTLGSICRIGITLSSCFWLPASLLMGLAAASGVLPDLGVGPNAPGLMGFASGFLQGIGCSIANDVVVVLGALGFAVMRGFGAGPNVVLRQKSPEKAA